MFHRCRRCITKASAKHSYYREVTSVNRWHIIVISPYCAKLLGQALIRVPVILPKCLAHYTILRPSIKLVTASATTEATWTQEHIFQLSTAEMQCECTWLLVLVWSLFTTCNTELAPPPVSYTGLARKSYGKASCPLVATLDAWSLEQSQSGESLAILWTPAGTTKRWT